MSRMLEAFRVVVGFTVETTLEAWSFFVKQTRQKKLAALRTRWLGTPKGTLVVMSVPFYVTRQDPGGGRGVGSFNGWNSPDGHIIQPGQGAMIMNISWPVVVENYMNEEPVKFVFWCNDGLYEWKCFLEHFSGVLPFGVLE